MLTGYWISRFWEWYTHVIPNRWLRTWRRWVPFMDEVIGISVHTQHVFTPMFHDRTYVGRGLSLFFRLAIIIAGSFIILLTWFFISLFPIIWFGAFFLWFIDWQLGALTFIAIIGLYARRVLSGDPWGPVRGHYSYRALLRACPRWLEDWFLAYTASTQPTRQIGWWLSRIGITDYRMLPVTMPDKQQLGLQIWSTIAAREWGQPIITFGDVILALTQLDPTFAEQLAEQDIHAEQINQSILWYWREQDWWRRYMIWDQAFLLHGVAGFNRALTGVPTPTLDRFSVDLTAHAHGLLSAIGREADYQKLYEILQRSDGENVMLLGPHGVGKTTFVQGLAELIMTGRADPIIANRRLVKLEPGRLIAGATTQGDQFGRLVALIDDIKASENIILFLDDVHTMMTAEGKDGGVNLFSVLEESLKDTSVMVIAATTDNNFKHYLEPQSGLMRQFSTIHLHTPTEDSSLQILENVAHGIEHNHNVTLSINSLYAAIKLGTQFIHDSTMPDSAIDLLDESASAVRQSGVTIVTAEDVARTITWKTGVPVQQLESKEKDLLLNLEDKIHADYVAQDHAVTAVADALRRARSQVTDDSRPIASFMFVGPTGVGKTELARQLARLYFGSEASIVRLDMTEFSQAHMIKRLIGAPVGDPGYGVGGELTEKVRRQPFTLVLLDELEKAHPSVWDLLMQVLDEGHLTDAAGLQVDFTNTMIICTSNAVTDYILTQLKSGRTVADMDHELFELLTHTFRVELLNRFDSIVPFTPLEHDQLMAIAKFQLDSLKQRVKAQHVTLTYTQKVLEALVSQVEDQQLGARPLRRLIQDTIEAQLARALLERTNAKPITFKVTPEMVTG